MVICIAPLAEGSQRDWLVNMNVFKLQRDAEDIGVATNRQEEATASSCFDWPIANDKDFVNGLLKFDC